MIELWDGSKGYFPPSILGTCDFLIPGRIIWSIGLKLTYSEDVDDDVVEDNSMTPISSQMYISISKITRKEEI
jgi:hypothetical protein